MKYDMEKKSQKQLRDVAVIGAKRATMSISKLLKKPVRVRVSATKMMDAESIATFLGGRESLVAVTYFDVKGDFSAGALLVFPLKMALKLSDFLLGRRLGTTKILDEFSQSAIKELGNISSASYLVAICEAFGIQLIHSVPGLAIDMLQAVLDSVMISQEVRTKKVIVLDTIFEVEKIKIRGHFLFLPDPKGIEKMLRLSKKGGR